MTLSTSWKMNIATKMRDHWMDRNLWELVVASLSSQGETPIRWMKFCLKKVVQQLMLIRHWQNPIKNFFSKNKNLLMKIHSNQNFLLSQLNLKHRQGLKNMLKVKLTSLSQFSNKKQNTMNCWNMMNRISRLQQRSRNKMLKISHNKRLNYNCREKKNLEHTNAVSTIVTIDRCLNTDNEDSNGIT
jgi:hypothetical protein